MKPNGNSQYLKAIVVMTISGMVLISALSIGRPNLDILAVVGAVFGVLTPTTVSLLAFMKAQETHLSVNSRLDQFIKNADLAARAEGQLQGRDDEIARQK